MSHSNHTPGTWTAGSDILIGGEKHFGVGILGTTRIIALTGKMGANDEAESIANSFILSAALDMLDALKAAVSEAKPLSVRQELRPGDDCTVLVEITEWADWVDQARAAIKKAEGAA